MLYICIDQLRKEVNLKWSELIKIAESKGYKFKRHGANHDIYEKDGEPLVIPRHQQKEILPGLYKSLKKKLGF